MMKRYIPFLLSVLVAVFFIATVLQAQDQTEVTIRVKKDGKVVKDTTYQFENETDAKDAVEIFEVLSGEGPHKTGFNYTVAHNGGEDAKTMVFVSKDGEKTEIKEIHGDSLIWIAKEGDEGEPVKVIKYKVKKGDEGGGEHVVVITSADGGTYDILLDEDTEGNQVKKEKRVKVIVEESEGGSMHISEEKMIENDDEVYVIKGDNAEKELKEVIENMESSDDDNVKVIIIKKDKKSEKETEKKTEKKTNPDKQ
jgi:hypothetical protein